MDVILVHGLTGSSAETWEGPIKLRRNKTLWPEEYLFSEDPRTSIYGLKATEGRPFCKSVRVLIVEHGLFLENADPKWTMENVVKILLEDFKAALVGCRPIVWIGHSIGGLLIKELLYAASKAASADGIERTAPLVALTRGIIFLGTPHFGATSANSMVEMRLAKPSSTIDYLKPRIHFHELQNWFDKTRIEYVNAVEGKEIPSNSFSGLMASIIMRFIGLRIVQVNDSMITMGSEPHPDLSVPIRYNIQVELDHWAIGNHQTVFAIVDF